MKKYDNVIGIDPDSERSGVAYVEVSSRKLEVSMLHFPQLIDYLGWVKRQCEQAQQSLMVFIEAGWLNHGNWHTSRTDSVFVAAKKGLGVGRNQQTGILIAEMCEAQGVPHTLIKPLTKCWKGKDRKITQAELEQFTGPIKGRINQEGRDAALIAWHYAGLPIKVSND